MTNAQRNGESPNPLRAYQEQHLIPPPIRLPEALVNDLTAWAKAYGETPSQFMEGILREGLRARMFPSDAVVISGPQGPISVRKLRNSALVPNTGKHQEA